MHTLIFLQVNRGVLETLGVKHCITSAYHPQANGQAERTNRNIKEALAKYCGEGQNDWDAHLKGIVASINTSKQVILCNSCICIHSTLNQDKKKGKMLLMFFYRGQQSTHHIVHFLADTHAILES